MSNNGGKWITRKRRMAIYNRDGFQCGYCGRAAETGAHLTLDHIKPLEHGGSHATGNLITACYSCNSRKQALSMRAWYKYMREVLDINTDNVQRRVRRLLSRPLNLEEGARIENLRRQRIKNQEHWRANGTSERTIHRTVEQDKAALELSA